MAQGAITKNYNPIRQTTYYYGSKIVDDASGSSSELQAQIQV